MTKSAVCRAKNRPAIQLCDPAVSCSRQVVSFFLSYRTTCASPPKYNLSYDTGDLVKSLAQCARTNSYVEGNLRIIHRSSMATIYQICALHLPEQTALPVSSFDCQNGQFINSMSLKSRYNGCCLRIIQRSES